MEQSRVQEIYDKLREKLSDEEIATCYVLPKNATEEEMAESLRLFTEYRKMSLDGKAEQCALDYNLGTGVKVFDAVKHGYKEGWNANEKTHPFTIRDLKIAFEFYKFRPFPHMVEFVDWLVAHEKEKDNANASGTKTTK